jgi:hypothetical protein
MEGFFKCTVRLALKICVRIAHVFYTYKDLNKAHEFLLDFGFQEVKRAGKGFRFHDESCAPEHVFFTMSRAVHKWLGTSAAIID